MKANLKNFLIANQYSILNQFPFDLVINFIFIAIIFITLPTYTKSEINFEVILLEIMNS